MAANQHFPISSCASHVRFSALNHCPHAPPPKCGFRPPKMISYLNCLLQRVDRFKVRFKLLALRKHNYYRYGVRFTVHIHCLQTNTLPIPHERVAPNLGVTAFLYRKLGWRFLVFRSVLNYLSLSLRRYSPAERKIMHKADILILLSTDYIWYYQKEHIA